MIEEVTYWSLGGGTQSSIGVVLSVAKDKRMPKKYWTDKVIFCDPGDEQKETYDFLNKHLFPFLKDYGVEPITIDRGYTLLEWATNKNIVPLGHVNPLCSSHFKRDLIRKYYRDTHRKEGYKNLLSSYIKVNELIGITTDEIQRAKPSGLGWLNRVYPFIEMDWSRDDCIKTFEEYGLPIPIKSGCWYCPNNSIQYFQDMNQTQPQKFKILLELEENAKKYNPINPPTMKREGALILLQQQQSLDDFDYDKDDQCDGGFCFT